MSAALSCRPRQNKGPECDFTELNRSKSFRKLLLFQILSYQTLAHQSINTNKILMVLEQKLSYTYIVKVCILSVLQFAKQTNK